VQGEVHGGRDLADQQVPRAVVQLALLLRQRPHPAERVQSLEHVERSLQPAARHPIGVLAVPDLPVELRVVPRRGELVEHVVDGGDARHLAQADAHHLRARHHDRGAVLLARERDDFPVAAGDLLHFHAGDATDALVRVHDPVADVQAPVADLDLGGLVRHCARFGTPRDASGQRDGAHERPR
jgi:hypothetical protein